MKNELENLISLAIDYQEVDFVVEHPADPKFGDYSTNVAMVLSKKNNKNPKELASEIIESIQKNITQNIKDEIEKIEIAGPGFINFFLNKKFFQKSLHKILDGDTNFGKTRNIKDNHILIDYTDPNTFKQFHIGHLMSNTIGESIARILEWNGAKVTKLCYQGDVGPHVARAIWAMKKNINTLPKESDSLTYKTEFLGKMYVEGENAYKSDDIAKGEIDKINQEIYKLFDKDRLNDDVALRELYEKGRYWSLQHFDEIYAKLGTNFSQFVFESTTYPIGEEIVREFVPEVFELSEGAVIYRGEKKGLHTRVFINSLGLTTYEAKDIGLAIYKDTEISKKFGPYDKSIIITANEQSEYFKVVLSALSEIKPEIFEKTKHIAHGMMKFVGGKMSSRKGNIITGENLIKEIEDEVALKIEDRGFDDEEKNKIKEIIATGAIKYTILKQAIGKDIIFDPEKSISFEGNSGPYLQYTYTRAKSILDKASENKIEYLDFVVPEKWQITNLERKLYQLPEIVSSAFLDVSPQYLATYTTEVASEFNTFYGNTHILDNGIDQDYKLALVKATMIVLQNSLKILGIKTPDRM